MKNGIILHDSASIHRLRDVFIHKREMFRIRYPNGIRAGFTLVELLIAISILMTLLGAGLASFNSFNRRERLKQAALTLKSTLRLAQIKSISVEKPASGCTDFVGMRMRFTLNSYTMVHECSPEGVVGSGDTVTFSAGITFSPIPSDFTFMTRTNTINSDAEADITVINGSESYHLTVSPNGSVNDEGFQ